MNKDYFLKKSKAVLKIDFEENIKIAPDYTDSDVRYLESNAVLPFVYNYFKIESTRFNVIAEIIKSKLIMHNINLILLDFKSYEVDYVLLKGFALSITDYPHSYLRPFSDVDLLIHEKDYEIVKHIFLSNGYFNPFNKDYISTKKQFVRRKNIPEGLTLEVDIHLSIFSDNLYSKYADNFDFFSNSLEAKVQDQKYIILSRPYRIHHSLIHFHIHFSKNDHVKLVWLLDIHYLFNNISESETLEFINIVNSFDDYRFLYILKFTNLLFPCEKLSLAVIQLSNQGFNFDYSDENNKYFMHIKRVFEVKGFRKKISYIVELILLDKKHLLLKFNMPKNTSIFTLIVKRIFYFLFK